MFRPEHFLATKFFGRKFVLRKKIAWQIHGRVQRAVELEDLIQQGMEGLVSSAQKYSPKEGVTFQQYAQLRIRGSIIDYLRKNSNLCRTTIKKKQELLVVRGTVRDYKKRSVEK